MFNFAEYEAKVKEAAATVGVTATAYAERICAKLDLILEAVTDPEFDNRTEVFSATLTAAGTPATLEVPRGEDWKLTYLATAVDAVVTMSDGQRFLGRWDTAKPPQSAPLLVKSGTTLNITVSADTAIYVQFSVAKPAGTKRKRIGGRGPDPTTNGTNLVDENVGRHGPGAVTRRAMPLGDTPTGGGPQGV